MSTLQEYLLSDHDVDLDEQLAIVEEIAGVDPEDPRTEELKKKVFVVDDRASAQWALRKMAQLAAEIADVTREAEDEIARIVDWRDRIVRRHQRGIDRMEFLLTDWHRQVFEQDPSKTKISLPSGHLQSRETPVNIGISDEAAFAAWARKDRPEFVKETLSVRKQVVKDAAIKDGEVLPYVSVLERERRFYAHPQGDE